MKTIFVMMLTLLMGVTALGKTKKELQATDWNSFEAAMQEAEREDRKTGWSYIASGALVTIGGLVGASSSADSQSKLIYGLSQGFGVAAIGYGTAKLSYGNEYNSFYDSIQGTELSLEQKNSLVSLYMENERAKREMIRKINIATHAAIGVLNLYSASREPDKDAKTALQFLAAVNFAFALSYTF
ncbi:MAG: hypothetical protein KF681_00615 [Bdellovibrionaceae bacterium]|nr:hypothetical protein [Pseudobdellovibrionaceae bacterium]